MILVPESYHVFSKEEKTWVSLKSLARRTKSQFELWNGTEFNQFSIVNTEERPKFIYKADEVTKVGLKNVSNVKIDFQVGIPPSEEDRSDKCTTGKHVLLALKDFSPEISVKKSKSGKETIFCKVPNSRLERITKNLPHEAVVFHLNQRFSIVQFPSFVLSGSWCNNEQRHSLEYAKMVISLCGEFFPRSKYGPAHIRLSDCGFQRKPSAFRRMRRILTVCNSVNKYYVFKVFNAKNGKQKPKRQVKITQREKCYFSPRLFKAKLFCEPKFSEQKEEPVQTWVSISSSTDIDTIVIEGIRFAFE